MSASTLPPAVDPPSPSSRAHLPYDVLHTLVFSPSSPLSPADLRRLALVSRPWHDAAYARLYNTLELRSGPGHKLRPLTRSKTNTNFAVPAGVAREVRHLKVLAWTAAVELEALAEVLNMLPGLRSLHVGAAIKASAPARTQGRKAMMELERLTLSERASGASPPTVHDYAALLRLFSRIDAIELSGFGALSGPCTSSPPPYAWHGEKLQVRALTVHPNVADDTALRVLRGALDPRVLRVVHDGSSRQPFHFLRLSGGGGRIEGLRELSTGAFYRRDHRVQTRGTDEHVVPLALAHCPHLRVLHLGVRVMLLGQHGESERAFDVFVSAHWRAMVHTLQDAPPSLCEVHLTLTLDRPLEGTPFCGPVALDACLAQLGSLDWPALRRARELELLKVQVVHKDVVLDKVLREDGFVARMGEVIAGGTTALARGLVEVEVCPSTRV